MNAVSGEAMNRVYEALAVCPPAFLRELWLTADPLTQHGAYLRHQVSWEVERRLKISAPK